MKPSPPFFLPLCDVLPWLPRPIPLFEPRSSPPSKAMRGEADLAGHNRLYAVRSFFPFLLLFSKVLSISSSFLRLSKQPTGVLNSYPPSKLFVRSLSALFVFVPFPSHSLPSLGRLNFTLIFVVPDALARTHCPKLRSLVRTFFPCVCEFFCSGPLPKYPRAPVFGSHCFSCLASPPLFIRFLGKTFLFR